MFSSPKLLRPLLATLTLALAASMTYGQKGEEKNDTEVYEAIGVMFAHGSGLARMEFTAEEIDSIIKGIRKGMGIKEIPAEVDALQPKIQSIMQAKMEAVRAAMQKEQAAAAVASKQAAQKYFVELAKKPGIQKDPSGFYYEILKDGTGKKPTMQDKVKLHYHGTLIDGTVFDSSVDRGQPATFPMGGVIKGFSGGLTHVKVGGKIRIHIPSDLGYGDNPRPGGKIKPGDTLIFECELLEIQ